MVGRAGCRGPHVPADAFPVSPTPLVPTLADCRAAILAWFHAEEVARMARPIADDPDEREAVLDGLRGASGAYAGAQGRDEAAVRVQGILAAHGFTMPDSGIRETVVAMLQNAMQEGVRRDLERYGEWVGGTDASLSGITVMSPPPPAPTANLTFGALIDRYLAAPERAGLSPKTKLKYAGFRRVLVEIIGRQPQPRRSTGQPVGDAQAVLLPSPRTPSSVGPC